MPSRSAKATIRSTRARTEFTFQVAMRMPKSLVARVGAPLQVVEEVVDGGDVVRLGAGSTREVEFLDEVHVLTVRAQTVDDLVGDLVDGAARVTLAREKPRLLQRVRCEPLLERLTCLLCHASSLRGEKNRLG